MKGKVRFQQSLRAICYQLLYAFFSNTRSDDEVKVKQLLAEVGVRKTLTPPVSCHTK